MMGAVNVRLLVLLVWTFTAVSEAIEITFKCEGVTARVGDGITFKCNASYLTENCCVLGYKFIEGISGDPTICRDDFSKVPCIEMNHFSCPYTANKPLTTVKFFVQTTCGGDSKIFSVNITDAVDTDDKAGGKEKIKDDKSTQGPPAQTDKTTIVVIICVLSCFVIVIVALFLWKKQKTSRSPPDYHMGVSRPAQDYVMCVCENNTSEPSDGETMLKETSVNVQIEKPQCQCNCNHSTTSS